MLDLPRIVITARQVTAIIPVRVRRSEIQQVMGPGIQELMSSIAAQAIAPAGPWFTHHLQMEPEYFDLEIGIPVSQPVKAAGRMLPSERPAMTVAQTTYRGPYEGLGTAWSEFEEWISSKGHTSAVDLWECYVAGPESSPDPAEWRTQLDRPLKSARAS